MTDETARVCWISKLSNSLSRYVTLAEGVAVVSTDFQYGHLPRRDSIRGVSLVPLLTHPVEGSEAVIHQLLNIQAQLIAGHQ